MPSLSTQERKAKFNKISNLLSGILQFLSTDTFFHLRNGYKLLGTKSKQIPKISLFSTFKETKRRPSKKYNQRI